MMRAHNQICWAAWMPTAAGPQTSAPTWSTVTLIAPPSKIIPKEAISSTRKVRTRRLKIEPWTCAEGGAEWLRVRWDGRAAQAAGGRERNERSASTG